MALFNGCGVAMVTPFDENGINYAEVDKLIEHIIKGNCAALFVCGTTGEPSTMTKAERVQLISYCVKKVNKRIVVYAGAGGNNTAESVSFAVQCQNLGVDGLLIVTPYYNKCTQNGLVAHFRQINDAVNIPIIAYNVPTRTGFNIAPETYLKLAELSNVKGIKEASGNIDQMLEAARLTRGKLDFYSGDDSLTIPSMSIGGKGVISVAANVIPNKMSAITALAASGKYAEACDIAFEITPFVKALFSEVNPIPCKKALEYIGIKAGVPRLPLTEMEQPAAQKLKAEMIKLGLIKA